MSSRSVLLLILLGLLPIGPVARGQGTIIFVNSGSFPTPADRLVYADFDDGNGPRMLVGTDYLAQLYYGATVDSLQADSAAPSRFRVESTSSPGAWSGGVRTLVGFTTGNAVTMVVRAWDGRLGSYDNARMLGGLYGESVPFEYIVPPPGLPTSNYLMDNFRAFIIARCNGTIRIRQPTNGAIFLGAASLTLEPDFLSTPGVVTNVTYRSGLQVMGTVSNPPFSLSLSNLPVADYNFQAVAQTDTGAFCASAISFVRIMSAPKPRIESSPHIVLRGSADWQGRRVSKIVSNWVGGAWQVATNLRFVYDSWNLLAELNNAVISSYMWGLDLSGSEHGAGGVGGLLSTTSTGSGSHFFCFDGSGNVSALTSNTNGSAAAQYEYEAFHQISRATGPLAQINSFLGATKFYDWETGIYYFGYRYYIPSTGAWPNRDPLDEIGFELIAGSHNKSNSDGLNLYAFVHNAPITHLDYRGLFIIPIIEFYPDQPPDPAKTHVECWRCFNRCIAFIGCFARRPGDNPQLNPVAHAVCMGPIDRALPSACKSGNVSVMQSLVKRAKICFDHHW